ncbi:Clp protease N-terminal domain-containing protein [Ideonella paludis]
MTASMRAINSWLWPSGQGQTQRIKTKGTFTMSSHLKTLISKLNDSSRKAAERAASLCMARGHYEVDLEHLFLALLEQPQSDFTLLCRRHEVSPLSCSATWRPRSAASRPATPAPRC